MNPVLFVVLLTAATGVGGLALGGGLAATRLIPLHINK